MMEKEDMQVYNYVNFVAGSKESWLRIFGFQS